MIDKKRSIEFVTQGLVISRLPEPSHRMTSSADHLVPIQSGLSFLVRDLGVSVHRTWRQASGQGLVFGSRARIGDDHNARRFPADLLSPRSVIRKGIKIPFYPSSILFIKQIRDQFSIPILLCTKTSFALRVIVDRRLFNFFNLSIRTLSFNHIFTMKTSFAAVALALSGSAMAAPFSNGTRPAFTSTPRSSSAQVSSTDPPLPNPFASSTGLPSGTSSSGAALSSGGVLKRGEALSIPTDLPSLVSDAQSVAAALASAGAGAQKRGEALSIPTDLPSLLSDAQSIGSALASSGAGAKKRGEALSIPTDLPSLASDAQSVAAALASAGAQKRDGALSIPTDLPSLLSDAQSVGSAIASAGAQKRGDALSIPTSTPLGTATPTPSSTLSIRPAKSASASVAPAVSSSAAGSASSSGRPLPTPTGVSPVSMPLV
jgi:hypothetical protein